MDVGLDKFNNFINISELTFLQFYSRSLFIAQYVHTSYSNLIDFCTLIELQLCFYKSTNTAHTIVGLLGC